MPEPVEAPRSAARRGKIEKHETIKHGEFAPIAAAHHGKKSLRRMDHEIGDGHFAREDESRDAREEADRQKDASDKLKNSGKADHRKKLKVARHG